MENNVNHAVVVLKRATNVFSLSMAADGQNCSVTGFQCNIIKAFLFVFAVYWLFTLFRG